MKGKWNTRKVVALALITLLALLGSTASVGGAALTLQDDVAAVTVTATRITWKPLVENGGATLTISGPDYYLQKEYGAGARIIFRSTDDAGDPLPDGVYVYQLDLIPIIDEDTRSGVDDAERGLTPAHDEELLVQGGAFTVAEGFFVVPAVEEGGRSAISDGSDGAPADQCIYDDLIVTGSFCVGFDCECGMSFGFDTIVLKEHNLRILFDDSSYTASYPRNDWRIAINDSINGGASYFGVEDVTGGRRIFTLEAGAPANSLYVEDYGRVGLGTSTPVVELHIKDSDTPTMRLEQDSSGGWTAQTWDVAGNESNFFIRDVTHGSALPFRIQPGTPSSTLNLKSDGSVGIGTWSPAYPLELETTGENAVFALDRTDGATGKFVVAAIKTAFGSVTNHKVEILVNDSAVAEFQTDGDLSIDGYLHEGSDVNAKEAFVAVDGGDVLERLDGVSISTWSFKASDDDARHMGPMAQDFYAAYGLGSDDRHISAMDVGGVALSAIKELDARNEVLEAENVALRSDVSDLEARVAALEAMVAGDAAPTALSPQSNIWLIVGLLLAGVTLGLGLSVCLIRMARRDSGSSLLKVGG